MAKKAEVVHVTIENLSDRAAIKLLNDGQFDRLQNGKATAADIKAAREVLMAGPTLWRVTGDLADATIKIMIQAAAGESSWVKESMMHGVAEIKERLGYDDSPMLEQLLIDAVVLAWLRWSHTEYWYTHNNNRGQTLTQADYWDRHLNAAQRRYLRALSALARIRKMDLPPMQINIGGQQINIAGRG